ncbi:MAG: hypothetical protein SRB1_00939 [Desulfobacteraceae bacterium Eth-SRB1]|nr:MAG: hypothetical protein SRB1_00939 [Desulfobacteraceae bacterium Eth-SRB1]
MKLPKIGDIITAKEAVELCRYFSLDYLLERIESDPESYKNWKFDGCSGLRESKSKREQNKGIHADPKSLAAFGPGDAQPANCG